MKKVIPVYDRGDRTKPVCFMDQIICDSSGRYPLFVSLYGSLSALKKIKPTSKNSTKPVAYSGSTTLFYVKKDGYGQNIDRVFELGSIYYKHYKLIKIPNTDLHQLIVYTKSGSEEDINYNNSCYISAYINLPLKPLLDYYRSQKLSNEQIENILYNNSVVIQNTFNEIPEFKKAIFKIINTYSNIPVLEDWMDYLLRPIENDEYIRNRINFENYRSYYSDLDDPNNIICFKMYYYQDELKRRITDGLRNKRISIDGCSAVSDESRKISNVMEYLSSYSSQLINKAQEKFSPIFNPNTDQFNQKEKDYFEFTKYYGNINCFNAQKNVMAAISRSLKINRSAFLVATMGSGKTLMSIGSVYLASKKKNTTNIVMAPGHLVEKWKREIEHLYPLAKAYIITRFDDLYKLDKEIKNKQRRYPIFLVISKDTAKLNYIERPSVIPVKYGENWAFMCPKCGASVISSDTKYERYHNSHFIVRNSIQTFPITEAPFIFANKYINKNDICRLRYYSSTKRYNDEYREEKNRRYYSCGSSLWTATNSKEDSDWIKFTGIGFVHKSMFQDIIDFYENNIIPEKRRKEWTNLYKAVKEAVDLGVKITPLPRRYSIARYIRNKYKGLIDFFIADEVHMYSSNNSAQSNAFGDFVEVAKKTLTLTGTLLNGYANGIYYILYKMYPKSFNKYKYKYESVSSFVKDFGVYQEIEHWHASNGIRSYKEKTIRKTLPGVSPELFTKFLMDKAIFLDLDDMSTNLPKYTETPIGIELDDISKNNYRKFSDELKTLFNNSDENKPYSNMELAFQSAQKLAIYPDQPFDITPIFDRTGKPLLEFTDSILLEKDKENFISNKDIKVLELVDKHLDKGENVLIYVNYVNKTECTERLEKMFARANIKSCTLTANIAAKDREEWIDKKVKDGYRVMICNPSLVETGLDLLSFTTIIFYQVGFNLFTMRQASRRSLRLNQPNNVNVYFLYYENTTQETVLSLMANKLQAAMAIEGKFSEEGLNAMSNGDNLLNQIAESLISDIQHKVDSGQFSTGIKAEEDDGSRFKMVYMLDDKIKKDDYSLFKSKGKTKKINYNQIKTLLAS